MSATPVYAETIHLRRSAFQGFTVWAGIDRGCSLTKVAFVPKSSVHSASASDSVVPLRCLTFLNEHFEDALRTVKEEADLPESGKLHVTGIGCANFQDIIKSIIGLELEFINELITIGSGAFLLLSSSENAKDLFYPDPVTKAFKVSSEMLDKYFQSLKDKQVSNESDSMFPAVILYVGSGSGMIMVDANGVSKMCGGLALAGRPFMGLANALLGTTNYEEVIELARKGDNSKVDWQARDIIKDDPDSPYGRFSGDVPVFAFGKASENSWDRSKCSKEDIAKSLVSFITAEVATTIITGLSFYRLKKAYLCGNFFRADIVRDLVAEKLKIFAARGLFTIKTIKSGHLGAIASMLIHKEEEGSKMKW